LKKFYSANNGIQRIAKTRRHPSEWPFSGYNEIQGPNRKNVLINYKKLTELLGFDSYDEVKKYHKRWVDDCLGNGNNVHDDKWTMSIAVGNKSFVERVKSLMGALARGRKNIGVGESFQLREPAVPYGAHLGPEKCNIGLENTYFWDAIFD
jgi:putative transposase